VRWCVGYTDQHGKRRSKTTFATKKAAKAYGIMVGGQIAEGTFTADSESKTVAEAAGQWLQRGELEGLERSTLRQYGNHVAHLLPLIGGTKLSRLTTPAIHNLRDELLARHSRPLARKILSSLKSIIGEAQRRGLIVHNPALPVTIDAKARERARLEVGVDIPSMGDVNMMLEAATGRFRPFLVTAIFTGMRASELRGLAWNAVDFDKRTITVRQRADQWNVVGPPKSAAGSRSIPMSPMVVNTLREWRLACPKGPLDLVFPTQVGTIQTHANIVARFYEPLQRQCLGKTRYGLHALRHFFASWCISQGFSPKRVQALMGHSSIGQTMNTYTHLFPSEEDDQTRFAAGEAAIRAAGGAT
jgi:integrase